MMIGVNFSVPSSTSIVLGVAGSHRLGSAINLASILGFPELVVDMVADMGRRCCRNLYV